jgi:(1->4)-alpha-D-glucan 1-alpha-D-glucosylmutase
MRIPLATYRLQFCPDFGFADAIKIVDYLAELGISDVYASPIFKARSQSTHGYDVVDPNQINPELGTEEEFEQLISDLQSKGMGWLQDIVPNHMAYDSENKYLMDILENGRDSEYIDYFDIDWEHPYEDFKNKILAPMMGDFYGNSLENGEIKLSYDRNGLSVNYYALKIPLRIESYTSFIGYDLGKLTRQLGRNHPDFIKLLGILYLIKNIPTETSGRQRKDQAEFVKELLWELYEQNPAVQEFIEENIKTFNGEVGNPSSFDLLDNLLAEQFFRLSFWKVGAEELNYRRFFTVNELICVRIEDQKVFQKTHNLIGQLIESGKFTGLRIDHVDGLYDPTQYLQRLREKMGDTYIVVEKILEFDEELSDRWEIQGTSGYDSLNQLNGVFSQVKNKEAFDTIYDRIANLKVPYDQLLADKKRLIAETNLGGDVDNLARFLKRISGQYRYGRDFTLTGLKKAILEVLVQFPVYCTYIDRSGVIDRDRHYIQETIEKAKSKIPQLVKELNLIEKFLLLDYDESFSEEEKTKWLHFTMRLQQVSGPLMAKGIEDTLFYVYNRLVSLNEVGGYPQTFGLTISEFHQFNQKRQQGWLHAMNATSTHDTKRSEDVRARLNVLSEIPDEWDKQIKNWQELNRSKKIVEGKQIIPDNNDEYLFYQNLLGAFPFVDEEYPEFVQRIKDYIIKAVREAKIHTAWLRPDTIYEEGFLDFIDKILKPDINNQFLEKFRALQKWITPYGILNSLSQTLLKITIPGIPDFYQGTELWDLSLVDPDNRRPVDYEKRWSFLQEIKSRSQTDLMSLISDLKANPIDGKIKLFLIVRALAARNKYLSIFQQGNYVPLPFMGEYADNVIAFARHYEGKSAIAIVPRFLTQLIQPDQYPLGDDIWKDTCLSIPSDLQSNWHDAITDQPLANGDTIPVGQILKHFPVALLISQNSN